SPDDLNNLLFKESGLLGISGISRDMREITQCADLGETRAQLAIDAFCYQVKRSIGSMLMILGGCDALIFTGGIGENSELVRKKALSNCENLGFSIDDKLNENCFEDANAKVADISAKGCRVKTLVIRTFEELMMARQCLEVATREGIMFK
ncbi:MAG: propionate/acetate kinase, partial [Syntrophaceae bacterium]|nr:propionate/acetate kinase [Syntrophaceae bacterium]